MQIVLDSWQDRAQKKVADTLSKIPPNWRLDSSDLEKAKKTRILTGTFIESFLDEKELGIIRYDTVELAQKIRTGQFSAVEVTAAFCRTAAVAHQINNCLHEIFFDQALQRAEELDQFHKKHGRTMGPLHGIPVSLKDQFHVKGNDTTMGYVGWIGTFEGSKDPAKVHQVESQVVKELLSLGAVLYCTTSLPQTLLIGETINNIIGQTLNPHNQLLSCGGSSGGEAALKALRGSTVGLGTDIGGSVRIPAAFCGIFSLKPTPERFSYRDVANTNPGQNTYRSTVGFLSTTIDGLQLIASSVLSTEPWLRDPAVVPLPWRQRVIDSILSNIGPSGSACNSKPLKIGMFWNDGIVQPQPPIARGLREVADALSKAGHKMIDWEPPSQESAKRIHLAFLKADGAHHIHEQLDLSGEPLIPPLRKSFELREPISLLTYQDFTLQGLDYEAIYTDYWQSTGTDDGQLVDAVVMPVAPHAAVIPGKFYYTAYTEAINLMNYSACVIPVTKADKNIDTADKDFKSLSEIDQRNWDAYDAETYHGAPVGLQIVGRKFQEEKVLAIATAIKAALRATG